MFFNIVRSTVNLNQIKTYYFFFKDLTKSHQVRCYEIHHVFFSAVDSSHISMKPALGVKYDYFNYKKYYSVILLAVVNS